MKRTKKETREHQVLLGLVDLYLEMGKPIGSNTLREHGFESLSSATIRNYFVELEKQGYLRQPHSSGGRVPTGVAFKVYAQEALSNPHLMSEMEEGFQELGDVASRNLIRYLQNAAEKLSESTGYAVFLSSVRFDHDFILDIKLVSIDSGQILCVLITDFGQILTEVLNTEHKLSSFALKRIELFMQTRFKGQKKPPDLTPEEEAIASTFYNEIIVRYLVRYSNFSDEDIYRTGFSKLLAYPEFNDPVALASGLSLFENISRMRLLLGDCCRESTLRFWVEEDLAPYVSATTGCSVAAIPYYIGQTTVGAVGVLGPSRMPYRSVFGALKFFSESISKSLTKSLYKYKLSFRQPRCGTPYVQFEERAIVDQTSQRLLEIKE